MATDTSNRCDSAEPPASAQALSVTANFFGTNLVQKHLARSLGRRHRSFSFGSSANCDVASTDSPSFALVEARADIFVLRFCPSWHGLVAHQGRLSTLRELLDAGLAHPCAASDVVEYRIPSECTIQLQIGALEYWIRPTGAATRLERRKRAQARPLYPYALASALFFLVLLLALPQVEDPPKIFDSEALLVTARLAEQRSKALDEAQRKNAPAQSIARNARPRQASAQENRLFVEPGAHEEEDVEVPPPATREAATRRARSAGILGIAGIDFDSLVPKLTYDASDEAIENYGALRPQDVDKATGAWGHGLRKIGPGSGDGKDWGSVKSKYKMASETQTGNEYVANALKRPPEFGAISVSSAAENLVGAGLGYDVIRGQLGLRRRRLRKCFELDLTSEVGTPGTLILGFHISAQGDVGAAEVENVEHPMVRRCVEGTLLSIRFPQPSDGKEISIQSFEVRI